jgi:hypothetical protein
MIILFAGATYFRRFMAKWIYCLCRWVCAHLHHAGFAAGWASSVNHKTSNLSRGAPRPRNQCTSHLAQPVWANGRWFVGRLRKTERRGKSTDFGIFPVL